MASKFSLKVESFLVEEGEAAPPPPPGRGSSLVCAWDPLLLWTQPFKSPGLGARTQNPFPSLGLDRGMMSHHARLWSARAVFPR